MANFDVNMKCHFVNYHRSLFALYQNGIYAAYRLCWKYTFTQQSTLNTIRSHDACLQTTHLTHTRVIILRWTRKKLKLFSHYPSLALSANVCKRNARLSPMLTDTCFHFHLDESSASHQFLPYQLREDVQCVDFSSKRCRGGTMFGCWGTIDDDALSTGFGVTVFRMPMTNISFP